MYNRADRGDERREEESRAEHVGAWRKGKELWSGVLRRQKMLDA
jgi:hypothetical protein